MRTVLVTTTFSKSSDELRFRLALKTCDAAREHGYPLIVVDGSPHESMRDLLREHGATVFKEEGGGMGASRRQTISAGLDTGAEAIIWLEPEKYPIVGELSKCIDALDSQDCDLVVPARESLESYPMYQELSELRANRELGFITGRPDLDLMIGPRVMTPTMANLMLQYTGQAGGDNWEILFIPVLWMLQKEEWSIGSRRVNYVHPPEQTAAEVGDEEMNKKRDFQRHSLVASMRREAQRIGLRAAA